jgi:Ca2+-binding EF-hand superfamily protein
MGNSISAVGGAWAGGFGQVDLQAIQQQRLEELFKKADTDGDGVLSKTEFVDMLKQMAARMAERGMVVRMPSADEAFSKADANGDGAVTRDEFAAFLESMRPHGHGAGPDSASAQGDPADANGDGAVSDAEYLAYYGVPRSDSSLDITV